MKKCKGMCGRELPLDEFYSNGAWKRAECKKCTCLRQRAATHGITEATLMEMYLNQHGLCAVCMQEFPIFKLVIDHDHACCSYKKNRGSCGKCIRGLLCSTCNQGIGLLKEDPATFARAIVYLQGHPQTT